MAGHVVRLAEDGDPAELRVPTGAPEVAQRKGLQTRDARSPLAQELGERLGRRRRMQSLLCRQLEHAQHGEIRVVVSEHPVDPVVERLLGVVEVRDVFADRPRVRARTSGAHLLGQVAGESFEIGGVGGEEREHGHRVGRLGVVGVEDGHEPARSDPATSHSRDNGRAARASATCPHVRHTKTSGASSTSMSRWSCSSQLGRTQLERPDQTSVRVTRLEALDGRPQLHFHRRAGDRADGASTRCGGRRRRPRHRAAC